jgi:hypothetical protein
VAGGIRRQQLIERAGLMRAAGAAGAVERTVVAKNEPAVRDVRFVIAENMQLRVMPIAAAFPDRPCGAEIRGIAAGSGGAVDRAEP